MDLTGFAKVSARETGGVERRVPWRCQEEQRCPWEEGRGSREEGVTSSLLG